MRRSSLSLRNNNPLLAAVLTALLSASAMHGQTNAAPADFGALIRLLDRTGIKYDRSALESGAIESAVMAVDRRARLRDRNNPDGLSWQSLESAAEYHGRIGYLLVDGFFADDSSNLVAAVKASVSGQSALIIDLRAAGGNDYSAAAQAAELLHSSTGLLYSIEDFRGGIVTSHVRAVDSVCLKPAGMPVMVMIDNSTDDASEFFAALLKGKPDVVIAGVATRGDPYMRRWLDLDGAREIYLAVSRIRATGCEYLRTGVAPDVVVEEEVGIRLESREPGRGLVRRYTSDAAKKQKEDELALVSDLTLRRAVDLAHAITSLTSRDGGKPADGDNEDNKAQ